MTVKKIVYLSFFSVLLLIFIFTLGIPLLGKFADFLNVVFNKNNPTQTTLSQSAIQPPILDSLPDATNSARLSVTGFSASGGKIQIFDNDEKVGETASGGGHFKFDDLTLKDGINSLAVKVIADSGKASDFSPVKKVSYLHSEPALSVSTPSDGQTISGNNRTRVSGKTDHDVQVYANGFLANTTVDGAFEVFVPLFVGENNIEVKAIDLAGNTKTVKIKVNFNK